MYIHEVGPLQKPQNLFIKNCVFLHVKTSVTGREVGLSGVGQSSGKKMQTTVTEQQ